MRATSLPVFSFNNSPVGVFDSGVGGLSILLEIQKLLPNEPTIFVADQSYVPYGEKTPQQLLDRVTKIIQFLVNQNCKAIVIACNTATVYTIEEVRKYFNIPIIGTVPAVKTLSQVTKTKCTGVLSTPATTKSPYLANLIRDFAPDLEVNKISGESLEQLVEEGEINHPMAEQKLQNILAPYLNTSLDALVLGCTHYPFLRTAISKIFKDKVTLIDSGTAIAKRLKWILETEQTSAAEKLEDYYYTTADATKFHRVAETLMNMALKNVAQVIL